MYNITEFPRQSATLETRIALKTAAVAGVVCLLVAVGVLNAVPPAEGYEISIYGVYPWYFWAGLIGATFLGQAVIAGSAIYGGVEDRSWVFGLALVLVSGGILLFLPVVRGYPVFGGEDVLTHVGFVRDIAEIGITGNIYPLMHLVVLSMSHATGLGPAAGLKFFPIVLAFVLIGGLFYLASNFYNRTHALYVLPFVIWLFFGYKQANPFEMSLFYVPFILYLFIKEQRMEGVAIRACLVVSVFGMVLFHPLTSLFLIFVFGMYLPLKRTDRFGFQGSSPTMLFSIATVLFAVWNLHFVGIIRRFEKVFQRFTGSLSGNSELDSISQTVNTYSPDLSDLVVLAVIDYGLIIVLYSLASAFLLYAVYMKLRDEIELNIFFVLFSGVFVTFSGLAVLFFINDFFVSWGRVLGFGNVFASVLASSLFYFLHQYTDSESHHTELTVALGAVLLVLTLFTVFNAFASVPVRDANPQTTEMRIDGTEWVLENRNEELPVDQNGISLWRFEDFHYGTLNASIPKESGPPDHFGYDENETLGESYDEDRYMVVTELGRLTYPVLFSDYPEFWRFTPDDYRRLERDPSVAKLYDNGELETYRTTTST